MVSKGWKSKTLGDLVDEGAAVIQTGPFGSQLHSYDYQPLGVAIVPTEAIGHRRLNGSRVPRISPAKASDLSRHRLKAGDILFARRGARATGYSAIVETQHEGWICGTGAILLRLNTPNIDPAFLSFYLAGDMTMDWLRRSPISIATGGWVLLEEDFGGSSKAEARARAVIE